MALYLDDQTRSWLERKAKVVAETDFIGKRVQKMLRDDRDRIEAMGGCEHITGEYLGKKTCCAKCGSFFDVGMGQSWTLKTAPKRKIG